ncbi:MAG: hypothetical protein K0M45_08975 [Candidatus Paracaedibacteraceae bacterium]|nr:hypothetical protein [Candidatus Paracaedibacteraceae bacterium]
MKNYSRLFFAFSSLFLTSCTTHSVVKSMTEDGKPFCKMVNGKAKLMNWNNTGFPGLLTYAIKENVNYGLLKFNEDQLTVGINYFPRTAETTPLKKPAIILKTYHNSQLSYESKIEDSYRHEKTFLDGRRLFYTNCLIFNITKEQFNKMVNADKTEILIQTHYDPLVLVIDKEHNSPLLDFNKQCLLNIPLATS